MALTDPASASDSNAGASNAQVISEGEATSATELIEVLNELFENLRAAPPIATDRRIAMEPLIEVLEQTAEIFPRLQSKSADLQSQLYEWSRQSIPDFDDDEPF